MIANEHDRDERQDGEKGHQESGLGGHGEELQPEGAGAPRVEGEPALDAVGEVPALPQLLSEKVDGAVRHGAEYSTRPDVLSRDFSMNSSPVADPVRPPEHAPVRHPAAKILSGLLLALGVILLKTKALLILGAVTLQDQPRSAYDDAQIGLAGPIFGTAACLIVLQIWKWTGDPRWLAIAGTGFALNLINLLPIGMLDGGRISGAVTKWMWVLGGGALVYKMYQQPNPLMILVLLLVAFQVYASIVRENDESFYDVTLGQRAAIAAAYFILVVFLGAKV